MNTPPMPMNKPPDILKLLSHDLRWQMVRALANSDYRVQELASLVEQPLNLVSYHLKQLRQGQVVTTRRSEADGRDTYYSLDLSYVRTLFANAGNAIHPAVVASWDAGDAVKPLHRQWRVLFVCTHNSARSQMAEGLLRHLSKGRITVSSAGSQPGRVHPDAIRTMNTLGIDIQAQYAKGFDDVMQHPFDVVITVCDHVRENCPTFPGVAQPVHWGFSDPSVIEDDQQRQQAFTETAQGLQTRIQHFLSTLIP